jgi:hypothetical protein
MLHAKVVAGAQEMFEVPSTSALVLTTDAGLLTRVRVPVEGSLYVFDTHICWRNITLLYTVDFADVKRIEKVNGLFGIKRPYVEVVYGTSKTTESLTFVSRAEREKIYQIMKSCWVKVPPRLSFG